MSDDDENWREEAYLDDLREEIREMKLTIAALIAASGGRIVVPLSVAQSIDRTTVSVTVNKATRETIYTTTPAPAGQG